MTAAPAAGVRLADHTTLGLGGPAARFTAATGTDELIAAVAAADAAGEPLLVLGGGSNLVVADEGFPGTVVQVATAGVAREPGGAPGAVRVRAEAGVEWDPFVARCVAEGLSGVECLSGIPGRVGSTPIQNVGAYGQEVAQTVAEVVVYDRRTGERRALTGAECGFSYRDSVFKREGPDRGRYVVCEVVFELEESGLSAPVAYAELAGRLGVAQGERVPADRAREAVLELRRGKGMVLDPADPDTRSAGSFFTNPVLTEEDFADLRKRVAERLGPDVEPPAHPAGDGRVKTSAAWLIDRAGFAKGHARGPVRISTKHTLALTNPGGGTTADLIGLAREVRSGVAAAFGVTLVNEPVMVGVSL
ncbi:UDP-N-acetylmuramate dehydrogenase [Nocardiopsis composta]|uniref:UDP-N-acetylenolpyruvoylglucosamine reductase n=1 Tax=Nocardiopsis composta TaxID=157465 RepID=A0A7W8QMA2_9ACTN|nr:UDP-N-acetylmuramate dehydrogenase [Nocardiopsis composta]MBB5433082.1 UDP-N-acetylmuramate dehydrogenase [Nocardiopsis composta]